MSDDEHKDKGFLSRWSQRKVQVRQASPSLTAVPAAGALAVADTRAESATPGGAAAGSPNGANPGAAAPVTPAAADTAAPGDARPPRPTLQDVEALTPESDYSRFVARDVDPLVKNSAMKKLFSDPHYNVMDRLDTYIDDYNTPDPIPKAMFRQLVQARMLGLLDDELEEQDLPASANAAAPQVHHAPDAEVADAAPLEAGAVPDPDAPPEAVAQTLGPELPGCLDEAVGPASAAEAADAPAAGPASQVKPLAAG